MRMLVWRTTIFWRMMMSRMTRWMTMMISLRLMMLRRTDPKTGTHAL